MRTAMLLGTFLAVGLVACTQRTQPDVLDTSTEAGVDAADESSEIPDVLSPDVPEVIPYQGPDDTCPGAAHCTQGGVMDNKLYVGAAVEDISPDLSQFETEFTDTNNNATLESDEPFVDRNNNGKFDGVWIAGFGAGRPARRIEHPLQARAIAFRHNGVTVAWVVLDAVGYFINDMDLVRASPELAGVDVDRVIVSSTHCHECVDTVGLWGRALGVSGIIPSYQSMTHDRAARAVKRAIMALEPVTMRVAQVVTKDASGDTRGYVNDTRDPVLYDPTMTVVRFGRESAPTQTVATWVNWAAHPEYTGSENNALTPDYVHWLRQGIEEGFPSENITGLGGTTVFVQGALGGQVGPGGGTHPLDDANMPVTQSGLPKAQAAGRRVARLALSALQSNGADFSTDLTVSYRTAGLYAQVENRVYGLLHRTGALNRELLFYNRAMAIGPGNYPWVRSRVTYLQVGPVATITAPGELHPELWIGYDTMWSWGQPVLTETQNAPDLSMAPRAPYLKELMLANPGVRYAFVSGLAEDFLGYIVARFNFVLSSSSPYIGEANGDHYEETNSVGPGAEQFLQHPMMDLAQRRSP